MAYVQKQKMKHENIDPLSGEAGAHPVGAGVGAGVGAAAGIAGAAAIGAATGTLAGPIGTIAGATIGGIVGGLMGKDVAEDINPTVEEAYWRENFRTRPYVGEQESYDIYSPAFKHGVFAYSEHKGRSFDEIEPKLGGDWEEARGDSPLSWDRAKPAARDAFDRLHNRTTK